MDIYYIAVSGLCLVLLLLTVGAWWRLRRSSGTPEARRATISNPAAGNGVLSLFSDPVDEAGYFRRGVAFQEQGFYWLAISDFTKSLRLNPECADAYYRRGAAFLERGLYDQALADYQRAAELPHQTLDTSQALTQRGLAFSRNGLFDEALEMFHRALDDDPAAAEVYYQRAVVYCSKKQFDKAWADLHQAQQLGRPVNPEFLEYLVQATGTLPGEAELAESYFRRATEHLRRRRYDQALDGYRRALALKPDLAKANNNRVLVQSHQGIYEQAR